MITNFSQDYNVQIDKAEPKVKIGKDVFIYRTLYLITKEEIFKDKSKKKINFYLKSQIKEKSLLYLPKPKDSDIIIEDIKELIELALSLCILTNSANYKISIFTSSFGNIENNSQLLKYQGNIIYAKLNEFKKENNEEKKNLNICRLKENIKSENKRKSFLRKKNNTVKEYPSINFKEVFPDKRFGITSMNGKEKEKENVSNDVEYSFQEKDLINNEEKNYIIKSNSCIYIINKGKNESYNNKIPPLQNLINYNSIYSNNSNGYNDSSYREKLINSRFYNFQNNFNFHKNINLYNNNSLRENNKYNIFSKTNQIIKNDNPNFFSHNKMNRSNSNLNIYSINNNPKKYFWRTLHKSSSFSNYEMNIPQNFIFNKNGTGVSETNYTYKNMNSNYNSNSGLINKNARNKITYKTKYYSPYRFSYFSSKVDTSYSNNNYRKIKNIFTKKQNNALIDNEKQNKEELTNLENVKIIKNFLFKPSIITLTKNNFYDPKQSRFNMVKNIYNEFKYELKNISYKLDDYVADKDIECYINDLEQTFKLLGINLTYCLKEYCLYSYFDKYIKEAYPSIIENLLYDESITPTQISEVLNSLLIQIHRLKNEDRFNLVDYVRSLKSIKNGKLSSDFFEIFVLCPNYFELTKREITKKIALVLEIDCVTNNVTIENYINYCHIFKFGHLVKIEKKLLFINKLLHMIEGNEGPLQEKIYSDVQYLFKIDNRTKQILLGRPYEIKINFHMTLKINQIFNSIIDYFTEKYARKFDRINFTQNNTSNISSFSKF